MAAFRAFRRSRVLALLLMVLTVLGTSGSWHLETDDPDCAAPVAHDHANHSEHLGRAGNATAPTHCAICHWLQAFRSDAVRQARVHLASDQPRTVPRSSADPVRSRDRIQLPSRAPPALV